MIASRWIFICSTTYRMRFSSTYRHRERPDQDRTSFGRGVPRRDDSRVPGGLRLIIAAGLFIAIGSIATAQPPGTLPPEQIFDRRAEPESEGIPVQAFMFLSESKTEVVMPSLTWEELQRLLDLDTGMDTANQSFGYESLEIRGSTEGERAEMEVVLRLSIEPTQGRWVSIPLRMGNFHRLDPPDVSGVDEYYMTLAPDDSGYLLFAKTDTRSNAMLKMRVSARVDDHSSVRTLQFRLPDVPAKVELTTDSENITGEVIGRGDEVVAPPKRIAGGRTAFSIDSGGGTFTLRWGNLAGSTDSVSALVVDSVVDVRWDSPEDSPIASVELSIRNARGSIESLQLRLPAGAVVLDSPRLGINGPIVDFGAPVDDRDGVIRAVAIPENHRQERIDLTFDLQLPNDNASSSSPLGFRVPQVVDALRQRGEILIKTGADYRLRWLTRPWVRSELVKTGEEGSTGRTNRFRFDRASFELPVWLGEKTRQLRISSDSQINILDSVASLEMTIRVTGQTSDGNLRLDDADWTINSIEDLQTGTPVDSHVDQYRVIEYASGSGQSASIRILGELPLDPEQTELRMALPRVVEVDQEESIQNATAQIINGGRHLLVVDLAASEGLSRIVTPTTNASSDSADTLLRVLSRAEPSVVVGTLVEQPPRIVLQSQVAIELDGEQLKTKLDWTVSPALDLEGRLPIRIPRVAPLLSNQNVEPGGNPFPGPPADPDRFDGGNFSEFEPWSVSVDGFPATLRSLDGDRYELISERLGSETMTIRWRRAQSLRAGSSDGAIEWVALPRPAVEDVTVRGPVRINLSGNEQLDLTAVDSPSKFAFELGALPRDPLRVRLESRQIKPEELSIGTTILRTVTGRRTRYEQVLATIQGGDQFRIGLPSSPGELLVEAFIDGEVVSTRRDGNSLVLPLPGDRFSHLVDLRLWMDLPSSASWATVEPAVELPIGAGRVIWQIVAPLDSHIVWASPTLGRSMSWRFDGWKLYRQPSDDDEALTAMVGAVQDSLPPGNRYLYVGSDLRALKVVIASRVALWICIGSIVLIATLLLTHVPQARHPASAVAVAVLFGGLLAVAPDAAVLAGQFGIIALTLVVVMVAIRALMSSGKNDRLFAPTRSGVATAPPSTRTHLKTLTAEGAGVATTHTLPPPAQGEVSEASP